MGSCRTLFIKRWNDGIRRCSLLTPLPDRPQIRHSALELLALQVGLDLRELVTGPTAQVVAGDLTARLAPAYLPVLRSP